MNRERRIGQYIAEEDLVYSDVERSTEVIMHSVTGLFIRLVNYEVGYVIECAGLLLCYIWVQIWKWYRKWTQVVQENRLRLYRKTDSGCTGKCDFKVM